MHNHECEHELKYCDHCDIVYCRKCKREWGRGYPYYVYSYPWYIDPYKPTVTWTTTSSTTVPSETCTHLHESS